MLDVFVMNAGCTAYNVGFIPSWLSEDDPRPAKEQLHEHYSHGGGWHPQESFTLLPDGWSVKYPGDPPLRPLAFMKLRQERIVIYPLGYVAIIQPDRSFEICRMD